SAAALGVLWVTAPAGVLTELHHRILQALAAQAALALESAMHATAMEVENLALRRADEAVRESEELYRGAITQAGAVPYKLDYATNSYTFVGEGIQELTGYSA